MTTEKSVPTEIASPSRDAHLNSIFRAAPIGIGVVVNRCFTEVNDRFCEITGYAADELLGHSSRMLYPTEEEFEYVCRVKYGQIRRSGTGTVETRFRRKDNEIIDVLLSSSSIDASTNASAVTFTALDITERKRAEEALNESREKYRSIFEHSPEMIVLLDSKGTLIEANNKVGELLGYDRSELIGIHFSRFPFWSKETKDNVSGVFRRRVAGGDIAPYELEFLPRTGDPLTCWVHGTSLRDGTGTIAHVLLILTDVTDQRRAERALRVEESRARDYLDVAGVMLVALDTQQRVTLINRKGCAVLQRNEKEIIGQDWFDIAIPKGQREICRIVHALLLKGNTQSVEYFENSVVTGNGVQRIIVLSANAEIIIS